MVSDLGLEVCLEKEREVEREVEEREGGFRGGGGG